MGIHFQSRNAKNELIIIIMKCDESVTEYHHRIPNFWQKARLLYAVDESTEIFLMTIRPSISSPLQGSVFTDFRPLLDQAQRIEDRRRDIAHRFPRPDKPASLKNCGREESVRDEILEQRLLNLLVRQVLGTIHHPCRRNWIKTNSRCCCEKAAAGMPWVGPSGQ